MTARKAVYLGQEAFVLSPGGEIVRTVVARLSNQGYQFLNGDDDRYPHCFSYEEAACAAQSRISSRQAALRKELRALGRKSRAFDTEGYRNGVLRAPYRAVELRSEMSRVFPRLRRPRSVKKICVPGTYVAPGSVGYAVITPKTRSLTHVEADLYRPYTHFVLETSVTSVCFDPNGAVCYAYTTPFLVEDFYLFQSDAIARLRSLSETKMSGRAHFVSSEQERKWLEAREPDIPF